MLKVLIVDDEFLLRRLVNVSVNWDTLGFKIVGEAADGEEALEKIEKLHPDVLIIDINIPFINGIQVSFKVRELYPEVRIIILTGYDEFEYAQGAIRAGVFRYLLKPINSEELQDTLVDLREEIQKEKLQRNYVEKLENDARNHFELKKKQLLNDLIMGSVSGFNGDIQSILKSNHIYIGQSNHRVIVIEMDESPHRDKKQELLKSGVYTITCDIFSHVNEVCTFVYENSVICILGDDSAVKYMGCCLEVLRTAKQYLNCTVSIGIGGCYHGFDKISLTYQEALGALERRFKEGRGKIFEYVSPNLTPTTKVTPINYRENIMIYLRSGEHESLTKEIMDLLDEDQTKELGKETIQFRAMEIIAAIEGFLIENNLELNEIWEDNENYIELIKKQDSLTSLRHFILEFIEKSILLMNKRNSKMSNIVFKAKEYIEMSYSNENLSLDEIAEHIGVNSSYLSSLFKKELKTNIIEFITNIRLTKAKELMDQNAQVQFSKIAELVGYSEPYYFSKCFKKKFGVTPTQYVQMKQSVNNCET